jgi:hypothetical protein
VAQATVARWIKGVWVVAAGAATAARLQLLDVFRLQALGAFDEVELHHLSLVKGAVAISLDGTEVYEDVVVAFFSGDEAKSLGIVKPLYRAVYTIAHTTFLGF